jgi:hypothetical protein
MSTQPFIAQSLPLTFAERAAILTKYGIPAMPLEPRDKRAFLNNWQHLATTDADQIANWNKQNPEYNCAAVGRKGGFWILDVDSPTLFARCEQEIGHSLDELDTLVVKSSGEKRHYYFKHDSRSEAMGNFSADDKDGEMFSVRAHNAYVVSAGSIHPKTGQPYEIVTEPTWDEIPTAPDWLMDWLLSYSKKQSAAKSAEVPETIPLHSRNTTLTSLAGAMRRKGASKSAILAALRETNKQCQPPLSDSELKTIAQSMSRYQPAKDESSGSEPPQDYANASEHGTHKGLKLDFVPLSDIDAEIQEWLWENRIPKDALTNLSGDADKGKSLTLYDILARISIGADFPDGAKNPFSGQPKKVLLMFSEGSLKTTVKPRMMAMGANMKNVITLKSVSRKGEKNATKRQFYLESDLSLLREELRNDTEIVAIGFDPITNYLGDECNMNRSQDVRRVLTPLGELAEDCRVTIISIIHFSKNTAMSAIHRTGGAAALVEVPRAAWCCADDDDPENKGGFVFVRIKNNLGKRVGGLCYRIEEAFISIKGKQASVPRLVWGKTTEKTADDLLGLQNDPEVKGAAKARSWLEDTFKDDFARKSSTVFSAALAVGINGNSLRRGRESLQMETKKIDWQWYMRRRQGQHQPWKISTDLEENSAAECSENSEVTS